MGLISWISNLANRAPAPGALVSMSVRTDNPADKMGDPLASLRPETVDYDYRSRINRGELAIPTYALHEALRLLPMLGNYARLWCDAVGRLDWSVKEADVEDGDGRAKKQAEALRKAYEGMNVSAAIRHLALAHLFGYSALTRANLGPINWWNMARVGLFGAWKYNPELRLSDGKNGTMEEIKPRDWVIYEPANGCLLEYLRIYLRALKVEGYWDDNLEKESKRQVVVLTGAVDESKIDDYKAAAKDIMLGRSGALSNGTDPARATEIIFPPESRGLPYYENRLKMLDEWACKCLFGAPLIANTAPDSGTLAGNAHTDTASMRIMGAAASISAALQEQFDRVVLEEVGLLQPGEVALAYFELAREDQADPAKEVELTAQLAPVGWVRDRQELSERTGMKLTRTEPQPQAQEGYTQTLELGGVGTGQPTAPVENVAATALNGAQVESLLEIVQQVVAKQLPRETAAQVIKSAFPMLNDASVNSMLGPLASFTPAVPEALSNRIAESIGVPDRWLRPVRDVLAEVEAKAADKSLSAEELLTYLNSVRDRLPELFGEMDVQAFANVLEESLSGAALEGVRDAVRTSTSA